MSMTTQEFLEGKYLVGGEHWLHSLWRFPMFPLSQSLFFLILFSYKYCLSKLVYFTQPRFVHAVFESINTQFYVTKINLLFFCHLWCEFFDFVHKMHARVF